MKVVVNEVQTEQERKLVELLWDNESDWVCVLEDSDGTHKILSGVLDSTVLWTIEDLEADFADSL